MNRKNKALIFSVICIACIAIVFMILAPVWKRVFSPNIGEQPTLNANVAPREKVSTNVNVPIETKNIVLTQEPSSQAVLFAIATTFAEKFGSFSSQGNFENLEDAKFYMTERMKKWTDDYIAKSKSQKLTSFYGITTRAIKPEIITLSDDESQAQVLVTAQQEEFMGDVSSRGRIIYKRLVLDFNKVSGEWKVDGAVWQ